MRKESPMKAATREKAISLCDFMQRFPDEDAATVYIEKRRWPGGLCCPKCGSVSVSPVKNGKPMPYRCRDCREHFSVRTGTVLAESELPLRKWLLAIYLMTTARKGVSSIQMAKELGPTHKTAWFVEHRIRESYEQGGAARACRRG